MLINRPTETLTYRSRHLGYDLVFTQDRKGMWRVPDRPAASEWPYGTLFTDGMMLVLGRRLESLGWQRVPVLE